MNKLIANQTAGLLNAGSPAIDAMWDYELAGIGTPAAIVQLEAFLYITPENEGLAMNVAKAYVGYALGWVEQEYEAAYVKGDMDRSDRLRQRARLLYLRAQRLGLHAMRNKDKGIDDAIKGGEDAVRKYLKEEYTDKKDVGPLFWTATGWAGAIAMSLDQPDLLADLPLAKVFMEHAIQLDDKFFNGSGYVALGSMEAAVPAALGGNPEKGKEWFEKGLEVTGRKNQMLLVNYAKFYAVNTQNKDLYIKLLSEVIDSGDLGNEVRLNNKIARIRAERYLAQVDQLF